MIVYDRPHQRQFTARRPAVPTRDAANFTRGLAGVFPVDINQIWDDAGDDRDQARRIVEAFVKSGDIASARVSAAHRDHDPRALREAANAIRTAAVAVSATRLADLAELIVSLSVKRADVGEAVAATETEYMRVRDFLVSYRASRLRR